MLSLLTFAVDPSSPWLAVFGRAHPVLLHAPLGILPAIAMLEYGPWLLRRAVPSGSVLALAWLCALSAAAAAASGLVLATETESASELVDQHKVLGLVLAGLCLLQALLAFRTDRRGFRLTLLASLVAMVPAGHLGGSITHGRDFLLAPLHEKQKPAPTVGPANDPPSPDPTTSPQPPTAATTGEYQRTIEPLLARTCTKCHNEDKHKGDLLLTTRAGLDQGGKNGAVVVPGKPDESPLLQRCLLPLDDDDHMPPDNKPQPTAAELEALRAWIAAGAPE